MVEVFRTNVCEPGQAALLLNHIHRTFEGYRASFDLEDCDNILRVACVPGEVCARSIIHLLEGFGFSAEVLPDEVLPPEPQITFNY